MSPGAASDQNLCQMLLQLDSVAVPTFTASDNRASPAAALESPAVSEQAVTDAAARYVALLLGAVSSFSDGKAAKAGGSAAAADAGSPDEALAAAEAGAGSAGGAGSPLAAPPSKLRNAGAWEWGDAALVAPPPGAPTRKAASSDAVFELAQVGLAAACLLLSVCSMAPHTTPARLGLHGCMQVCLLPTLLLPATPPSPPGAGGHRQAPHARGQPGGAGLGERRDHPQLNPSVQPAAPGGGHAGVCCARGAALAAAGRCCRPGPAGEVACCFELQQSVCVLAHQMC